MYRDSRDVVLARRVAEACGQPHTTVEVGREFLSQFARYAERTIYATDGCAEVSHSPDLYAHAKARELAPVRMTGNYGGEVLRGVWSFKPWEQPAGLFEDGFARYINQAKTTYGMGKRPLSELLFRQIPAHLFGQLMLDQSQLTLRSPYLDNDLIKAVLRRPKDGSPAGGEICQRLVAEGSAVLNAIPMDRRQSKDGLLATCRGQALEFLFKAEYAYDVGMPQWMARFDRMFSGLNLEQFFLGRHKWYHFRTWYKTPLAAYIRDVLLDERSLSRPYVCRDAVKAVVNGHIHGDRNHTAEIHKLLTIELIQRQLIERS
jgi:asparagine synthase (glutamine-hydrolysing)